MEDGMERDCAKVEFISGNKSQASELNKLGKNSQYSINDYKLANILWRHQKIFLPEEGTIVKTKMKQQKQERQKNNPEKYVLLFE